MATRFSTPALTQRSRVPHLLTDTAFLTFAFITDTAFPHSACVAGRACPEVYTPEIRR